MGKFFGRTAEEVVEATVGKLRILGIRDPITSSFVNQDKGDAYFVTQHFQPRRQHVHFISAIQDKGISYRGYHQYGHFSGLSFPKLSPTVSEFEIRLNAPPAEVFRLLDLMKEGNLFGLMIVLREYDALEITGLGEGVHIGYIPPERRGLLDYTHPTIDF